MKKDKGRRRKPRPERQKQKENADAVVVEAVIIESLPNAMFRAKVENGQEVLAHVSGRIRKNFVKILPGDIVTVELSIYDLTRGRITWRK